MYPEIRQLARSIRHRPLATIGLTAILALGTGVVTAMFALADPFLLRALPYADPRSIVALTVRPNAAGGARFSARQAATVGSLRERHDLFESVAAYANIGLERLRLDRGAVVLRRARISTGFFTVLGMPERLAPSEAAVTPSAAARLLGDGTHGRSFARPGGGSWRIGTVLPETFIFPEPRGVSKFELLTQDLDDAAPLNEVTVIARLRKGQSIAAVRAAAGTILEDSGQWTMRVDTIDDRMTRDIRPLAAGALLAGLLILAVAIANATNLTVARCLHREREFATRIALGASRADIARLVLLEVAAVGVVSLAAGLLLASVLLDVSSRLMPVQYAALGEPALTARVWAFACLVATTLVGVGTLIPVMAWSRTGYGRPLVPHGGPTRLARLRFAFAAGQTAIAMILMGGAAVLVRSHFNLLTQETGFAGDVIVATVSYDPEHLGPALTRERELTIERLRAVPGITGVAAAGRGMLDNSIGGGMIRYQGQRLDALSKEVTPGYFAVVGSGLVSGRWFAPTDGRRTAIVINEALARRLGVADAVGLTTDSGAEVIGVVRNELTFALDRQAAPAVFHLMGDADACVGNGCNNRIHYVIRATDWSPAVEAAVRQTVASINQDAIVSDVRSIEERLLDTVRDRSFAALILSLFAAAGLAVSTVGLFSFVAFGVARRTREFSIRLAIGATRRHVLGVALAEGSLALAAGLLMGAIVNYWLTQALGSLTFGVEPRDPSTMLFAGLALATACLCGIAVPATRATRLNPSAALRLD